MAYPHGNFLLSEEEQLAQGIDPSGMSFTGMVQPLPAEPGQAGHRGYPHPGQADQHRGYPHPGQQQEAPSYQQNPEHGANWLPRQGPPSQRAGPPPPSDPRHGAHWPPRPPEDLRMGAATTGAGAPGPPGRQPIQGMDVPPGYGQQAQVQSSPQAPPDQAGSGRLRPALTLDQVINRGGVDMSRYDVFANDAQTTGPLAGRTQGSAQYKTPEELQQALNLLPRRDQLGPDPARGGRIDAMPGGGTRNFYAQARGSDFVKVRRGGGYNFLLAQQQSEDKAKSDLAIGYREALTGNNFDRANKVAEEMYRQGYEPQAIRQIQADVQGQRQTEQGPMFSQVQSQQLAQQAHEALINQDPTQLRAIAQQYVQMGQNDAATNLMKQASAIEAQGNKGISQGLQQEGLNLRGERQADMQQSRQETGARADYKLMQGERDYRTEQRDEQREAGITRRIGKILDTGEYDKAWKLAMANDMTGLASQIRQRQKGQETAPADKAARAVKDVHTRARSNLDARRVFAGAFQQAVEVASNSVRKQFESMIFELPDRTAEIEAALQWYEEAVRDSGLDPEEGGAAALALGVQALGRALPPRRGMRKATPEAAPAALDDQLPYATHPGGTYPGTPEELTPAQAAFDATDFGG